MYRDNSNKSEGSEVSINDQSLNKIIRKIIDSTNQLSLLLGVVES